MEIQDHKQKEFDNYVVPDQARILKVKKWLIDRKNLSQNSELNILEIGYSSGGLLDNLSDYSGINKYAVDINKKKPEEEINFYQCDCNKGFPDFDRANFDIVFAGEVIEHIYDDEQFLKNIHGILSKGGILVLTTPNMFFLPNRILFPFGVKPVFAWHESHYHLYDIRTLSDRVKQAGYRIEKIKSTHLLISSRKYRIAGRFFEMLGNWFPRFGAHFILFATKIETN